MSKSTNVKVTYVRQNINTKIDPLNGMYGADQSNLPHLTSKAAGIKIDNSSKVCRSC